MQVDASKVDSYDWLILDVSFKTTLFFRAGPPLLTDRFKLATFNVS